MIVHNNDESLSWNILSLLSTVKLKLLCLCQPSFYYKVKLIKTKKKLSTAGIYLSSEHEQFLVIV